MHFGLISGLLWGLDTVVLGIALAMAPYSGSDQAVAFASIVGAAFHDIICAIWILLYMKFRGRLGATVKAFKTRSGKVVALAALLGGPVGQTCYVMAITNIGAAYTAIISAFYPAFGALMAILVLKERMKLGQVIALIVALAGIIVMGAYTSGSASVPGNGPLGVITALGCVVGWGSEAVILAWGMRDDAVDNETALQIRETTSAIIYALVVMPLFGTWIFAANSIPSLGTGVIALAAFAGVASYLFYYKGISKIGAAKCMAANISYSAWAVVFGVILLKSIPGPVEIICCLAILCGTVLASSDWKELFSRKGNNSLSSEKNS